uniref:U1-type domain-containing protein n=1 Tax=Setaria viridis TaxID=4556 RepID=A0A4U6U7J9_SETVI|nr:hypothetical protein SEVIR_6G169600v2 [Setaria viridis]
MELADQTVAAARVDGDHSLPGASSHGETSSYSLGVAVSALRRELLKERIREEIITRTTERRNSEPKVRCEHAVPHHGISTARQADQRRSHMPLSPELRLGEARETPGVVIGWYRSPWHDRSAGNEDSSSGWARPPKKTFSGVKRKGTAETSVAGNENSFGNWSCALCHDGRRQENAEALWRESREIGGKSWLQEAKLSQPIYKNQRHATRWNCSICKASGASEFDQENHLRGQRHQQNVKARFL